MGKILKGKAAPMRLKVIIDNVIIFENTSTETFIETLKFFGVSNIAQLSEIKIEGLPLVVKSLDYRMQMKHICDDWYVCTHLSTIAKKRMLEKIAKKLCRDIRIEIV